jgi:hypothetical protein
MTKLSLRPTRTPGMDDIQRSLDEVGCEDDACAELRNLNI